MSRDKTIVINREISWLSFNERVLQEADDPSVPLIERVRFLGIYSNNRDEFFRVRVATLRRMEKIGKKAKNALGEDPASLLDKIQKIIVQQQQKFDKIYGILLEELEKNNIFLISEKQLAPEHGKFVKEYFNDHVLPTIAPLMVDATPKFPYLKDNAIYLVIKLVRYDKNKKSKYALIEVPTNVLSRFLVLPKTEEKKQHIILLEDVIRFCLDDIFSIFEYDSIEAHAIKMTRDAELDIDQDVSKSIVEKISRSLKKRKRGTPVRLTYDDDIPKETLGYLTKRIKVLKEENLISGGRYHNFRDFIDFPNVGTAELRNRIPHPLNHRELDVHKSAFRIIKEKDVLLTYPYQSYHHIIDMLREASIDPKVQSIKITLYRVAKNSNIVNTLVNAVKNGKSVTAVVELQARFDEEANIFWANKLQEEGVKVIFGVPNLKVHSKLFLISRKEGGKSTYYAHIGTGNFNEETARVYSDMSLLTADKRVTEEIARVFNFYEDNLKTGNYKHLAVAPFNMRKKLSKLINNEIENAAAGKEAYVILKMNNLVDEEMIAKLYEANSAGVKVKMIIRGTCSLVTELAGYSDNIEAISIVDKFLEHARVFVFCNGGDEKYFISSADWMARNLDHRSEVAVPVYDESIRKELRTMIDLQLNDNTKARIINTRQDNRYRQSDSKTKNRSQDEIYKFFRTQKNITPVIPKEAVEIRSN
ncbi:MAG TPA: polyphosphate kinase 1 [Bacteroidia bacterium]